MKTVLTICTCLLLFFATEAIFDLDELKSFNYGIDIRNEPIVMSSQEEGETNINTVHLTSKFGQPYRCSFPNTVENEKQKEEAEKDAMEKGIPDLLKPMESGPCLRKTQDWWSYEFCYGKHIKQFHLSEDGLIQGEVILLGYYESEYNWEGEDKEDAEKKQHRLRRYHTQQYVNGSKCDLSGKQRRTEVRFHCEEGTAEYIARLDEPETCVYIMTIHTMKICHHPFLKPPTPTQTVAITCNPLLTVIQYQDYLDQLEEREEKERLEEERRQEEMRKEEEELKKRKEEKAKYYRENNIDPDKEDADGVFGDKQSTDPHLDGADSFSEEDLPSLIKNAKQDDDSPFGMKTMFKVVESPEDLKDFLKDTIKEMKKLQQQSAKMAGVKGEEEEEEEEEKKLNIPDLPNRGSPPTYKLSANDGEVDEEPTDQLDDPELEELETEIKTLKERYKNRRDRLTSIKKKVKSSMEAQYANIIREAQEELAQDGTETEEEIHENREDIRQLTKAIDALLDKLDKTEKEIAEVDEELKQFAEYDGDEKDVKSIPPVRDIDTPKSEAKGPAVDDDDDDTRVQVRVSRIKKGSKNLFQDEVKNAQTEELERNVQKELEKAGLTGGDKIQVKIITTGYIDDDDKVHWLSKQESETFRNLIVDMIGGQSEVEKEQARHDQLEENYSFVWGKDSQSLQQTPVGSHEAEKQTTSNTVPQSETGSDGVTIEEMEDS